MRPGLPTEKVEELDNLTIRQVVGPNLNGKKNNVVQAIAETSGVFQIYDNHCPYIQNPYTWSVQKVSELSSLCASCCVFQTYIVRLQPSPQQMYT
jgi:hypothetical protein